MMGAMFTCTSGQMLKPPNLSVINALLNTRMYIKCWPKWNSRIPAGHTAYFKAYYASWCSWDTSILNTPKLQLDCGQTATHPFIKPMQLFWVILFW